MTKFDSIPDILLTLDCPVLVDGVYYNNIREWYHGQEGEFNIEYNVKSSKGVIRITVKEGMTKLLPGFGFHSVHNNNTPMPMNVMEGKILEDNGRMKKMDLWDKNHTVHWIGWVLKSMIIQEESI